MKLDCFDFMCWKLGLIASKFDIILLNNDLHNSDSTLHNYLFDLKSSLLQLFNSLIHLYSNCTGWTAGLCVKSTRKFFWLPGKKTKKFKDREKKRFVIYCTFPLLHEIPMCMILIIC